MTRAQCIVGECTADITLKPTQYISCFYCKIIVGGTSIFWKSKHLYLECFFYFWGSDRSSRCHNTMSVCLSGASLSKTLSSQSDNALENPTNINIVCLFFSSNIAAIHQPIPLFSFGVIVFLMIHTCNFVIYITSLILQLLFFLFLFNLRFLRLQMSVKQKGKFLLDS